VLIPENKASLESTLGAEGIPKPQADQIAEAVSESGGGNEAAFAEHAGAQAKMIRKPGSLRCGGVGTARCRHRNEQGDDRADADEPPEPPDPQPGWIRDEHAGILKPCPALAR
jgi:hypothetical protein